MISFGNIVQTFIKFFPLRLTYAQHFLLFAENLSFLHKMCDFTQNLSFCFLWSPFFTFLDYIFSLALAIMINGAGNFFFKVLVYNYRLLMREMVKNYCPRGEIQPKPIFTEARRAKVNSRLRLNITEGAIIFYHSLNKRAVNICSIQPIHRFCTPYWTIKVQNSATVTASPRVTEIVQTNTHGLVS